MLDLRGPFNSPALRRRRFVVVVVTRVAVCAVPLPPLPAPTSSSRAKIGWTSGNQSPFWNCLSPSLSTACDGGDGGGGHGGHLAAAIKGISHCYSRKAKCYTLWIEGRSEGEHGLSGGGAEEEEEAQLQRCCCNTAYMRKPAAFVGIPRRRLDSRRRRRRTCGHRGH